MTPPAETTLANAGTFKVHGFNFFSGVACSILAPLIEELDERSLLKHQQTSRRSMDGGRPGGYVGAVREDLALGLAAGAYLSGAWPAVLMQNSGLGYCLNVLTSLNLIYKIPVLLVVGYRGFQGKSFDKAQDRDAPEHLVMGAHCQSLLEKVGIVTFVPEQGEWAKAVGQADAVMRRTHLPAAILVRKGVL